MMRTRLAAIAAAAGLTIVIAACGSSQGDAANNAGFGDEALSEGFGDEALSENEASATNYASDALENKADAVAADGEEPPPVRRPRP